MPRSFLKKVLVRLDNDTELLDADPVDRIGPDEECDDPEDLTL
jgi:hypothetical protein